MERDRVLEEDEIKELAKKLPTANMAETASFAILASSSDLLPYWRASQDTLESHRF